MLGCKDKSARIANTLSITISKDPKSWELSLVSGFVRCIRAVRDFFALKWWANFISAHIVKARQPSHTYRLPIGGKLKKDRKPGQFTRDAIMADVDMVLTNLNTLHGIESEEYEISHFFVKSKNGRSKMDTMQLKPAGFHELPPAQRSATLILNGNTGRFEFDYAVSRLFLASVDETFNQDPSRTVVACNYDGVGFSTGPTSNLENTFKAVLSQIDRLVEKEGIPPENILIQGHSLGGLVAQYLLAKCHARGQHVRAWIDRTGPSLTDIITGMVWEAFDRVGLAWLGTLFSEILKPVVWLLLKLGNHEQNVAHDFIKVNPKYSYITTLRADSVHRRKEHLIKKTDDRVIVHHASLWRAIRNKVPAGCRYSRRQLKQRINDLLYALERSDGNHSESITELELMLAEIKRHKYYYPTNDDNTAVANKDGHGKAPWYLVNRCNGADMLSDFKKFQNGEISTDQAATEHRVEQMWQAYETTLKRQKSPVLDR